MFCLPTSSKLSRHNLNFHWKWRWWDQIQNIFLNLFYFILTFWILNYIYLAIHITNPGYFIFGPFLVFGLLLVFVLDPISRPGPQTSFHLAFAGPVLCQHKFWVFIITCSVPAFPIVFVYNSINVKFVSLSSSIPNSFCLY